MVEKLQVTPPQLRLSAGRVRSSGQQIGGARSAVQQALGTVQDVCPGPLTSAAALELAAGAGTTLTSLGLGVQALANALDAAATRYATTDALLASIGAGR